MYLKISDPINMIAHVLEAADKPGGMSEMEALKILEQLKGDKALQKAVGEQMGKGTVEAGAAGKVGLVLMALSLLMGSAWGNPGAKDKVRDMLTEQAFDMGKTNINKESIQKIERLKGEINKGFTGITGYASGTGQTGKIGDKAFVVDSKEKGAVMKNIQALIKILDEQKRDKALTEAEHAAKLKNLADAYKSWERGKTSPQLC